MKHLRIAIAGVLLALQAGGIVYARFVPARYFCWAPYDMQTEYTLEVRVRGRELTAAEVQRRYRRPRKGSDNRSAQHLIDIIEAVEARQPATERAQVVMRYRVNGKEQPAWRSTPRN
jgi:hypothetical protein